MNISHLILCTSLLAAPICAGQDFTEPEAAAPVVASPLPSSMAQKISSGDFAGLQTEIREALQAAGEQTKATQKLLQDNKYHFFTLDPLPYHLARIVSTGGAGVSTWEGHHADGRVTTCIVYEFANGTKRYTPGCARF